MQRRNTKKLKSACARPISGGMTAPSGALPDEIRNCRLCRARFGATASAHQPRPVVWYRPGARILIAGQAPGTRVHASGRPFTDPSGDRLRAWMDIDEATFYDQRRIAILPMAFCFPGLDAKGADLPPPPICAETWRRRVLADMGRPRLTLLVGGYAQKWHLGDGAADGVTATVARWREHSGEIFALPHPSWRNTGWIKKNPWFTAELLPELKNRVKDALNDERSNPD